jgi:serine/threonine protein kinase/Tol biopolymer transport system component
MTLASGTKVGQYEIISPLGAGSMGEVYRARDLQLNREVAIKILPSFVKTDPDRLARFEIEAKAAGALNHPNILSVYQMGTHDGAPYLVCELLEGKTLAESLRRGPLPIRQAIQFGVQIAHGLSAAHEKGIVHRDLKPENLFVTKDGRIKILDFGLAKVIPPKEGISNLASTVTRIGVAMGTVGYMSPEQVRGQSVDQRTDIFAFGAILYEMVMGKRSFLKSTEADTVSAILNEEPPPITQLAPDAPPALERVIRRCIEKNPEQRFRSASDLAFALEALSDPGTLRSGIHPVPADTPKQIRPVVLLFALALVCVAAFLLYLWMKPSPPPKLGSYVQLTHDGQPKSLIGTDGARIYLAVGTGTSASFSLHGVAEMSVAGGEPKPVALMNSSDLAPVDLSPDGSTLLVVQGQGAPPRGQLLSIPVLGGSPRRIGDFVAEVAAFSPDAKMLAYSNLGDLFITKADGTDSRKIVSIPGDIRQIAWSPDASHLRFNSTETAGTIGRQMEWEAAADGSGFHRLLDGWHNPPDDCCGKWTADGNYFIFQSQGQIWALATKGAIFQSEPIPIQLTASPMTLSSPLPSSNGKRLFLIGRTYRGQLMRYDSKSSQFTSFMGGISGEYLTFSNDRQRIAYVSYPDGVLWRSKIDGSDPMQLTYPPMYPLLPRWSPDGKTILFFEFAVSANKPARIYEISADGGSPRELLPNDRSQQLDPNWSPDGARIVFGSESNNPSSTIHVLERATGKLSELPGSQGLYSPRWSPDGRHISAFSGDSKKLLVFDNQTQRWSELANGTLSWLNWSHDGQYVYMIDFTGKSTVIRIRLADHKLEQVVELRDFPSTGRYGTALSLTPDDQPILLRDVGTQDVYSADFDVR